MRKEQETGRREDDTSKSNPEGDCLDFFPSERGVGGMI